MSTFGDAAFSQGDVMRELRALRRRLDRAETDRGLERASVGRGGLRVHGGGGVRIRDGGDLMMLDGGNLWVVDGGNAVIEGGNLWVLQGGNAIVDGGGAFEARDGSRIRARYADGSTAVVWGTLVTADTGEESGHGLLVQDDEAGDGGDIFRALRRPNGDKLVLIGSPQHFTDRFVVYSDQADIGTSENRVGRFRARAEADVFIDASEGDIILESLDSNAFLSGAGGAVVIESGGNQCFIEHGTTGASANCHITENGLIARSTSARRFKTDVADYQPRVRTVLDLAPKTYRDVREAQRSPEQARTYVGLVAEEVHELGLAELVTYNDQGEPESVQYDRLAVTLLGVVKQQQQQIDALTEWAAGRGYHAPVEAAATGPVPAPSPAGARAANPPRPTARAGRAARPAG